MLLAAIAAISIPPGPMIDTLLRLRDILLEDNPRVFMVWTQRVEEFYSPGVTCSGDCSLPRIFGDVFRGTPIVWNADSRQDPHEGDIAIHVKICVPQPRRACISRVDDEGDE